MKYRWIVCHGNGDDHNKLWKIRLIMWHDKGNDVNESKAIYWMEHMLNQIFLKTVKRTRIADMLGNWVPNFGSGSWERFVVCTANIKHAFSCGSGIVRMNFGQGSEKM